VSFTVALPVYNEVAILERLHELLTEACSRTGSSYEILYVNDGSTDATPQALARLCAQDAHVTVVELSRNFGHPAALAAGVGLAAGRSLVVMDADLQDDPAVIPDLLRMQGEHGAEVVYVVRASRDESFAMRVFFKAFHWLIARTSTYQVPRDAGSFGLVGPRALKELRRMTERLRYFPGLRAFVGFRQVAMPAARPGRYDGRSRVGFPGLVRLAFLALFTQSRVPVTLFYILSAGSLIASLVLVTYAMVAKLMGVAVVSWASTLTSIAFFSSVIILGQAVICEYLARVYEEVRGRPAFIVERIRRATVVADAQAVGPTPGAGEPAGRQRPAE
jgi:dolichol-phosphate mannosyltransferase